MGFKKLLFLVVIIVVAISVNRSNAQGVGNHLTFTLKNATQLSGNVIQFDIYVVSDGASGSDIRANAFQIGVNFNSAILQGGATITPSYVASSSDFIPPLNGYNFPPSAFPDHSRIVESVFSGGNTGNTMVVGQEYRAGTFKLTSSANFVPATNTNFALQNVSAGGKTLTAGIVWIGAATSVISMSVAGSGDGQVVTVVTGNLLITSVKNLKKNEQIKIFPNPIRNQFTISDLNELKSNGSATLNIYDILGKKVYTEELNVSRNEEIINFNAAAGVYVLEIRSGGKQLTQKLIVQ